MRRVVGQEEWKLAESRLNELTDLDLRHALLAVPT
jgi:hypothetical protein